VKSEIKAVPIPDEGKGVPEWETEQAMIFQDQSLYGSDWVMVTIGDHEPILIEISELKRVVKTL